jgi:hypothetical protein
MEHRLVIIDRGLGHRHRWKPSCVCGWVGVQRRRKDEAESQYREHGACTTGIDKRRRRLAGPVPQDVTPPDALPKELR